MPEPGIEGNVSRLAAVWWPVFRAQPVTAKHAIRTAYATAVADPAIDALRRTLLAIAPSDVDGFVSAHRLGRFLVRAARYSVPLATGLAGYPTVAFVERPIEHGGVKVWQLLPELDHEAVEAA